MIARILIWDLSESTATLDELRAELPAPPEGDVWISNGVADRFGLISFADEPPDLATVIALIGDGPVVSEEFDVE